MKLRKLNFVNVCVFCSLAGGQPDGPAGIAGRHPYSERKTIQYSFRDGFRIGQARSPARGTPRVAGCEHYTRSGGLQTRWRSPKLQQSRARVIGRLTSVFAVDNRPVFLRATKTPPTAGRRSRRRSGRRKAVGNKKENESNTDEDFMSPKELKSEA